MSVTVYLKRVRWSERRGSCVHLLGAVHTLCGLLPPRAVVAADDEWQGGLCLRCARQAQTRMDEGYLIMVGPEHQERFRLTAMVESRLAGTPRRRPLKRQRLGRRSRLSPLASP